jgi:uncharacterized protein
MEQNSKSIVTPVQSTDRLLSLDTLRGFAVLGILIMNIQSFSLPGAAYINPTAYGSLVDVNKVIWIISHLIASEKFISIFAMLFGAGILLFSDKLRSAGIRSAPLHYRRLFWLFVFGMLHAYLLWYGDILVALSLCGMLVFIFRKKKPSSLLWISLIFFIIPIIFYTSSSLTMPYWSAEARQQLAETWKPEHETIMKEIDAMRGSWLDQMGVRVPAAFFMQTSLFLMETFWRLMSMMLLGMALYKMNFLSGNFSKRSYLSVAIGGILIGVFIGGIGVVLNFETEWTMRFSMFLGRHFNYIGSVVMAVGYSAALILISKSYHLDFLKNTLAVIGRMAFSNYILQTIICTTIFYGFGFGRFAKSGRIILSLEVLIIWLIITLFSLFWLKYFRYGPLEWTWRSLTYWKIQPLTKEKENNKPLIP